MPATVNPETVIDGKHFRYQLIPAGEWRRADYQEDKIKAGAANITTFSSDEPRPHVIPQTEEAKKYAAYYSCGGCRGTILVDGEWINAVRFCQVGEDDIKDILSDLDNVVEWFNTKDD